MTVKTFNYSLVAAALLAGSAIAETKPDLKPTPVAFALVPSGHFIVKVKLNGKGPYNLIFDTGAPMSLISPRIAQDAKLLDKATDKPFFPIFGMMGQVKVKAFQVGDVVADDVPAMILDHPTVKVFSQEYEKQFGKIDGIVGFPFFSRYTMTVDYAAKELTFVPGTYRGEDVMQSMMRAVQGAMKGGAKPTPRVAAPAGLWGLAVTKASSDDAAGVNVQDVLAGGAAASAGLKPGDRLLTLDGRWTDSVADTFSAAGFAKPGRAVAIVIKRDGKEVKLTVTPRTGL